MRPAEPLYAFPSYRILQFAKAPQLGRVKTRMQASLTPGECLQLHQALTRQVYTTAVSAAVCPVQLWASALPDHDFFSQLTTGSRSQVRVQCEGDLGQKMAGAIGETLADTAVAGVIVIGSDCPFIDRDYLCQALESLERGTDALVGPANDGGYVLLGLKRLDASLFEGVDWGTSSVCQQTCVGLDRLGWRYECLAPLLDIDRPEDLALLLKAGILLDFLVAAS